MSDNIYYEAFGEISDKTPLEPFYNAMLPLLKNYGLTAEFPADKPSLAYDGVMGIKFDIWIGEPPAAIRYIKCQESPYGMGGFELTLESETLVHTETGEKLAVKIFITDYISGLSGTNGYFWVTVKFSGAESEVEWLRNAVAPVLTEYYFRSGRVKAAPVPEAAINNSPADSINNSKFDFTTNDVNFDELAQKSFAPGAGESDYEKLFAAVFNLSEWHFIADGTPPNLSPYCALFPYSFGDQPAVVAFTDADRAKKFMAESSTSFGSEDEPVNIDYGNSSARISSEDLILSVPTGGILDYIEKLIPRGIVKIFFNPNKDSHGFSNDLKIMPPIREHLESKNLLSKPGEKANESSVAAPPSATNSAVEKAVETSNSASDVNFDALPVKATETNAREDLNDLFGEVFALPKWHFIARGELPDVAPYVASNAQYADNQPMVRAFTDTERLVRFAKENNLTKADGSCDILTIPTDDIVQYLEGFIPAGAYGIWFNSDTVSDGFFIPLKQLRPIKNHLAKINWRKADTLKSSVETLQFIVKEGLMLPSAEIKPAPYTSNFFWRVPSDWVENGRIKAEHLRKIEREMSGGRSETIEGAFYVVTDYSTKVFEPEAVKTTNWSGIAANDGDLNLFFTASENGETKNVTAEEFQADVDAYFQTTEKSNHSATGVQQSAVEILIVQIKDGLGFPSGFVKASGETHHIFCRVPSDWTNGEQLKPENLEKIYRQLYGANWRMGNSDGSHYVVMDSHTKIFPLETVKTTKFSGTASGDENQFLFYIADRSGTIRKISAEEFQADIDASFKTPVKSADPPPRSNLQNWGLAESPDGEMDLHLNINKVGTVGFETSIAAFYTAILPLLEDYKGAGEYVSLLRFEPDGMSQMVENIAQNSHGAYLQIRRFLYLNPKNKVHTGVNSIHSNRLRHVRSNAELIVSIELCKNLDNQTAAFYYRFEGSKSEVLKLSAAIQPLLEASGYQAVQ